MPRRRVGAVRRLAAFWLSPALALSLSACSSSALPILSDIKLPTIPVPHILRIDETVDKPSNLIETALSECDKRIETGEAACVKSALIDKKVMVPDLIAMLHDCHQGQVCHYEYTTDDLVGFLHATSSHFVVHWRVDFDLTHPVSTLDALPVTVVRV